MIRQIVNWNKIAAVGALILAIPVVGSMIVQAVSLWGLPERVTRLEARFDGFDSKLNTIVNDRPVGRMVSPPVSTNAAMIAMSK
jgi:hypothetical protein